MDKKGRVTTKLIILNSLLFIFLLTNICILVSILFFNADELLVILILMLKQGTHPKIVQERLGHASIQITLDTYSHVAPRLQEVAATRFDEAFKTTYNKPENELVEKHY